MSLTGARINVTSATLFSAFWALWVVLALAGFAIAQMLGNSSQQYLVPQFVGQTKDQATQALNASDSHFKLGTVTESYSDSAPEGQVIDQTPSANKQAPEGTAVNLVISKGAKPAAAVKVPDLTNKSPSEAESALAAVGSKQEMVTRLSRMT